MAVDAAPDPLVAERRADRRTRSWGPFGPAPLVALAVLGNQFFFGHFLETVVGGMPHVSNYDAVLFGDLKNLFAELFAAFFIERGNRQANDFPVIRRIHAEISRRQRFFDRAELRRIPRLNGQ